MSRKDVSIVRGLMVAGVAALVLSSQVQAQDRADVLERIKPVGQVAVEGQAAPAAPAAPAPAAEAPAAAAETPAAAAEAPAASSDAASDPVALATQSGCLACHQVEMKVVGPAYKDVAAKYKGDEGALDMLVAKVQAGGVGTWGEIPMPPNPHIPEENIRTIVGWILSL